MKDKKQMLTKLIEIAVAKGFDFDGYMTKEYPYFRFATNNEIRLVSRESKDKGSFKIAEVLFNHEFAKAIFGKEEIAWGYYEGWTGFDDGGLTEVMKPSWEWHIEQLAITPEEDRVNYAYENREK